MTKAHRMPEVRRNPVDIFELPFRYVIGRLVAVEIGGVSAILLFGNDIGYAATPFSWLNIALALLVMVATGRPLAKYTDRFCAWTLAPRLSRPLGSRLFAIAGFLFSRQTMKLVVEPEFAELSHEWAEAMFHGQTWKARWIRYIRGPWSMLSTLVALTVRPVIDILKQLFLP